MCVFYTEALLFVVQRPVMKRRTKCSSSRPRTSSPRAKQPQTPARRRSRRTDRDRDGRSCGLRSQSLSPLRAGSGRRLDSAAPNQVRTHSCNPAVTSSSQQVAAESCDVMLYKLRPGPGQCKMCVMKTQLTVCRCCRRGQEPVGLTQRSSAALHLRPALHPQVDIFI